MIFMEISFLLPAAKIIQDAETKKYTYVDIFSTIFVPKDTPSIPQFFSIGGRILNVPDGDASVDVKIIHEDGTLVSKENLSGKVKVGDLDIVANFGPVIIGKTGKHFIRIDYNGVTLDDANRFFFHVEKQQ